MASDSTAASLTRAPQRAVSDPPADLPTVCLLIPVSSREDFTPIPRSPLRRLRNRLRRRLDRLAWRVGLTPSFHYSTYEDHWHNNRGDIAIRRASVELLREAFGGRVTIVDIGWAELPAFIAALSAQPDLLVIGGGGYYFVHEQGRLAERVGAEVALLRQIRCPLVSLSPGVNRLLIGPENDADAPLQPAGIAVLGELLGRLRLSSARDARSRDLLDRIVPGRTVALADPALFLRPAVPSIPMPAIPPGTLAIGLNIAFHGPDQGPELPRRLRLFAAAARHLARRQPCRFFYFVHADAERAIPALLRDAGIDVTGVDLPADQMLSWYAGLDLHICQMLHSSILSLNAGVPTINLAYDVKNAAFFEMMGLERFCLPDTAIDADGLAALTDEVLAGRAALARHIAARKAALRQDMDTYLAAIVALVPARPES